MPHSPFALRLLLGVLLVVSPLTAYSETLTWFSRANCPVVVVPWSPTTGLFVDESVTWTSFNGTEVPLYTATHHNLNGYALIDGSNWSGYHYLESVAPPDWFEWNWRSYAGHAKSSGLPLTWVHGEHWLWVGFNGMAFLGYTFATDCNLTEW
jgi:hypothetical protein